MIIQWYSKKQKQKINSSRCNIPVDSVAHRERETAKEQEELRPHTLCKQLQRWSTDCYSVKAEDDTGHDTTKSHYWHGSLLNCSKKCSTSSLHKCENNNNNSLTPTVKF